MLMLSPSDLQVPSISIVSLTANGPSGSSAKSITGSTLTFTTVVSFEELIPSEILVKRTGSVVLKVTGAEPEQSKAPKAPGPLQTHVMLEGVIEAVVSVIVTEAVGLVPA